MCIFFIALRVDPNDYAFFIGLRDVTGNNEDYQWERDGDNLTFANWAPGQPNTSSQRCAYVIAFPDMGETEGEWDDIPCTSQFGAICEADLVSKEALRKN